MFKFLDPTGATYRNDKPFYYILPRPDQEWSDWTIHPEPAEPDNCACGAGRLHLMKILNAQYAPHNWWPWEAEGDMLVGEDKEKAAYWKVRLRRISPQRLWEMLRKGEREETNLRWANLSGADLIEAYLRWAYLSGAYLSGANLRWADLNEADLSGANMRWANLSGANLSRANLSGAQANDLTVWPADFDWKSTGIINV